MRTTETTMWTGPLLPVGWQSVTNLEGDGLLPLARRGPKEKSASVQPPATSRNLGGPMMWAGSLPPGALE